MSQLQRTGFALIALIAALGFSGVTARADSFGITLTGNSGSPSGTGTVTTNGSCGLCFDFGGGILGFSASLGTDTGAKAFDLADDFPVLLFDRTTRSLAGSTDMDSETFDVLTFTSGTNWELVSGLKTYSGRYTIAALAEPSALAGLAAMILGLAGWRAWVRWKLPHQKQR